ncbi:hypothetical protein CASFOL_024845 [Castilleja foliolosa]|uniref:NAC domain-containing protein n=1 Tax=Castilleja foliolosa TaxID=1961234 RepID=A0ABD3CRD8_9LAMI
MGRFPIGFRFNPSEEEKLKYLVQKISGCKSMPPCDDFISTIDLYGEKNPWQIYGDSEDKERYFFTELKKVGKKRICRNVGTGTWSNKGQKVPIYGSNNKIIGHKRCFRYESKKEEEEEDRNNSSSCKWLLKEYALPDNVMRKEFKDYAFCVLKKKKKGSNNIPRNVDDEECGLDDLMESIMSRNCTTPDLDLDLDLAVPALPILTDDDRAVDIVEECGVDLPIVRDDDLYEITDSDLSDLWLIEDIDKPAAVEEATPIDVDMPSPPIIDLCSIIENIDKPATEAGPVEECSIIENMDKPVAEPAAEPVEDGSDFDCMFDDVPEDPSCDYNFSLADIPMDRFPALWT